MSKSIYSNRPYTEVRFYDVYDDTGEEFKETIQAESLVEASEMVVDEELVPCRIVASHLPYLYVYVSEEGTATPERAPIPSR